MAFTKCPKCGQDISETEKKCIHCGYVFTEEAVTKRFCIDCGKEVSMTDKYCPHCSFPLSNETVEYNASTKKMTDKTKKIIIPISIITIIAIITGIVINFMSTHLNEDEQLAYQNAVAMKNMMRDPDSFRLYDEMILLKRLNENGDVEYTYTIFKYGGTNGYGAVVTNEAIFKDGTYIMDYADEPDEDDPDYMEQLTVQSDLAVFELQTLVGDSDPFELVEIDVEKIKKKMEID